MTRVASMKSSFPKNSNFVDISALPPSSEKAQRGLSVTCAKVIQFLPGSLCTNKVGDSISVKEKHHILNVTSMDALLELEVSCVLSVRNISDKPYAIRLPFSALGACSNMLIAHLTE